ncbi:MAG: CPBP family intramembrane metalloprotease [Arenimonas sp.]|nr:CPBP family intramembrane metalloprotease [Arenimonas sp.]
MTRNANSDSALDAPVRRYARGIAMRTGDHDVRLRDRAILLVQSMMLPLLGVGLLVSFAMGTVMLSANDRAILWAEGTTAQLAVMQDRVAANPWFKHGRSRPATASNPLPAECGAGAREFSFASLGEVEGQAAREILEMIAAEAGARVCLSNIFMINELPDRDTQSWSQLAASAVLGTSMIPCAAVLFVYFAFSNRLRLGTWLGDDGRIARSLSWGLGSGLFASVVVALATLLGPTYNDDPQATAMTVGNVGYSLALALVLVIPVIEEVAFRGWMMPLAERGLGTIASAVASSALYSAASLPADAWSAAGYFCLGLTYAMVYLRTRSLLACIVANVTVSVSSFWLA